MPDGFSRREFLIAAGALLSASVGAQQSTRPQAPFASALPIAGSTLEGFPLSTPEARGMDSAGLADMTRFIENLPHTIFSMMIARRGHVVYEMLGGDLSRNASHYLMSVTKSLTSAIVGVALDRGILASEDQPITELLPAELFGSAENRASKAGLTLRHALNMSALDAPHIVAATDPDARANYFRWVKADNRVRYALSQRAVSRPMSAMTYTDLNGSLVNGAIHYRSGKTVLEFGDEHLFSHMRFRNHEWMGQDASGIDVGGYGMRLRPIDMLKFGQLYLQRGVWEGKRLLSRAWIDRAYASQITPRLEQRGRFSGYSNYWWHGRHRGAPKNIMANGWKGQRISVFPASGLVVTLTGVMEDSESAVYEHLISEYVLRSVKAETLKENGAALGALQAALNRMRRQPLDLESLEPRMRPGEANKEVRKPWRA